MRSKLKIVALLFLPFLSFAQVNPLFIEPTRKQADSLHAELGREINDTLRMAAYRELALYYLDLNTDSAVFYIEKDLPLAKKLNLKLWEADALDLVGVICTNQGNYVRAVKSYNEAIRVAQDPASEKGIWKISKFTTSGDPAMARLTMLATIQSDMAGIFTATGNREKERDVLNDCLATNSRVNDNTLYSQVYRGIAGICLRADKLDSALYYLKRSLAYSDLAGYNKYRSVTYNSLGNIYLKQQQFGLAMANFRNALQSAIEQNNYINTGETYTYLGKYYHTLHKDDSALYYCRQGVEVARRSGRMYSLARAYRGIVEVYKGLNRYDSALHYLELSTEVNDSLFSMEKIKQIQNVGFDEQLRLEQLEKERIQNKSRMRNYALLAGLAVFLVIGLILYRNNRQQQKTNTILASTLEHLKSTQSQLVQSEKMASLGELTAGIAHEIQNPLNFVNNFSEVNKELLAEMNEAIDQGNYAEVKELARDLGDNSDKINFHGKRADAIVKGMLQHSRNGSGQKEPTDINALCDEYLRLSYHGIRARDKSFHAAMRTEFDPSLGMIPVFAQDLGRVILNLINNAFYAVSERKRKESTGYDPAVTVSTKKINGKLEIRISDNGMGIPQKVLDKIFQPFFTTKPTGVGTGLGLSLSYDIVKAHGGEIKVNTKEGEGSEFIIQLKTD